MNLLRTALLAAGLLGASAVHAQTTPPSAPTVTPPAAMQSNAGTMSRADAKAAEDRIESQARADKKACDAMTGNAEDVCEAEAKAKEKVAKAELKHQQTNNPRDRVRLEEIRAEAAYEVAKEKCEDMPAANQAQCKREAKDVERAARAEARKMASSVRN